MGIERELKPEAKNCPRCGRIMAVVKKAGRDGEIHWMWRCVVCDYCEYAQFGKS